MSGSGLTAALYEAILVRNRRELTPFIDVFQACRSARAEHRELLQAHAEIRAQVSTISAALGCFDIIFMCMLLFLHRLGLSSTNISTIDLKQVRLETVSTRLITL